MKWISSASLRVVCALFFVMIADAYFHGWRSDDPVTYITAAFCAILWTGANAIESLNDNSEGN